MEQKQKRSFSISKEKLVLIAGLVWFIAGYNVMRLGLTSYLQMDEITILYILLSITAFIPFVWMFFRMSRKNKERILLFEGTHRPFWNFFARKSYIIMACMMSFGIALRKSSLVSDTFIAVFYSGLGVALALSGAYLIVSYISLKKVPIINSSNVLECTEKMKIAGLYESVFETIMFLQKLYQLPRIEI